MLFLRASGLPLHSEPILYNSQFGGTAISGKTLDKYAAVLLFQNSIVEEHEQSTIVQRADQPPKSLFQRDDCRRNLILKEGIATLGVNRLHPRGDDRIAGHGKRQAVDNHTAQLLSLYIHT